MLKKGHDIHAIGVVNIEKIEFEDVWLVVYEE